MLKKETTTPMENRATDMMKMLTDTRKQVETLEKMVREIVEGDADWGVRMEEVEDSIHALQLAISSQRIGQR